MRLFKRMRIALNSFAPPLTSLEERLVREVAARLSEDARKLLIGQLQRIDWASRYNAEVLCYMTRGDDPAVRFPKRIKEFKLATMRFEAPGVGQGAADLFAVNGYLFSIVFKGDPALRKAKGDEIVVKSVKIHEDPMVAEEEPESKASEVPLRGWLADWAPRFGVTGTRSPLAAKDRQRLLRRITGTGKLPSDYLELIEQSDGLVVGEVAVNGVSDVYSMDLSGTSYWVLAVVGGNGVLAVADGADDGTIEYLGYDGEQRRLGTSFREAVESVLQTTRV